METSRSALTPARASTILVLAVAALSAAPGALLADTSYAFTAAEMPGASTPTLMTKAGASQAAAGAAASVFASGGLGGQYSWDGVFSGIAGGYVDGTTGGMSGHPLLHANADINVNWALPTHRIPFPSEGMSAEAMAAWGFAPSTQDPFLLNQVGDGTPTGIEYAHVYLSASDFHNTHPSSVTLKFTVDGNLIGGGYIHNGTVTPIWNTSMTIYGSFNGSLSFQSYSNIVGGLLPPQTLKAQGNWDLYGPLSPSPDGVSALGTFHITLPLTWKGDVATSGAWGLALVTSAFVLPVAVPRPGENPSTFASSDFGQTLTFDSVLLPDGSTPESEGYTVSFDGGMTSPNIAAVPEPSAWVMLAFGGIALGGLLLRAR